LAVGEAVALQELERFSFRSASIRCVPLAQICCLLVGVALFSFFFSEMVALFLESEYLFWWHDAALLWRILIS
jgi:hypothetical protein